jgi:hypothetical protein
MTLVLTLDEYRATFDRPVDLDALKDFIVIVRPTPPTPTPATAPSASAFSFDDDDLITWEDAEWQ